MGRVAVCGTWWHGKIIRAAEGFEPSTDPLIEIATSPVIRFLQNGLEDVSGFSLHGMAVLGRADTQPLFEGGVELPDGDADTDGIFALHHQNVINEIIDVKIGDDPPLPRPCPRLDW